MASVATQVRSGFRQRLRSVWRSLVALRHPRRYFAGKLMTVMLLATAVALLVAGVSLLGTDLYHDRRSWGDDLRSTASILALATAPALALDDRGSANRDLAALAAHPSIRAAALYDARGHLYSQYTRPGATAPAEQLPALAPGLRFSGTEAWLLNPITQHGRRLGTIWLSARYDESGRLPAYLSVLGGVMVLGFLAAVLAAGWLQGFITRPMDSIMDVARQIVEGRGYSLRARKSTQDEFGLLIDAFNNMLAEVQARAHALEQSNAALQEAAQVRQAAEQASRASERLYRAIGESINYGVWVCNAEGENIYASDSFLALTGLSHQEYCSADWVRVIHPDDRDKVNAAWEDCVRVGGAWYHEHRIRAADGSYRPILAQGVPIHDDAGRIDRWAGIHLDIRRLKLTEQALREADRRKDEFLATLAHELRNPLAPIRNAVFILKSADADATQQQQARDVIDRQVRHMTLLLDDLLDVSRVTRGQFGLKKEYVDLKAVCDVAVETARPLIELRQHTLSVELPPQPITLEADPLRLAQVISNLLTNAAKYTDPGGRIRVSAAVSDSGLVLTVADTGIGLSPDSIPRLFSMFSQVDSAIDRTQGGLGIGLALVKGLIELHGGSVTADSAGLGRGSEFSIRLPPAMIVASGTAPLAVLPLGAAGVRADPNPRILVVDDNRDAAETLAMALGFHGYQVATAFSGAEALECGARERPQAIVLDIGMAGMDGYETVRRLRREPWGRHIVAIALTGWGQEQDRLNAQAAGFDEHLTKPVDVAALEEVLARLMAEQRAAAEFRLRNRMHA